MKKTSKALLLVLCAVLLVTASVMGTMAYLTSTDTVENTFTVGKVKITMDEADVNEYGEKLNSDGELWQQGEDYADRVKGNEYKLIPSHKYVKDPVIFVHAKSEPCYLFVKLDNKIEAYEAATNTIAAQMGANDWNYIEEDAVWVYKDIVDTSDMTVDQPINLFKTFTIADNAQSIAGWDNISPADTIVTVNAYAIQADGFANAEAAWDVTFGAEANG